MMAGKIDAIRRMDWTPKCYTRRKDTPKEIISMIIDHVKEKCNGVLDVAVDVGCGTGQSTITLAPFFKKVYGMDINEAQLREAESSRLLENVLYRKSPAESLPFDDSSVQLITAAASIHWFDLDKFFAESKRVLCHNGILAVYCYSSMRPLFYNSSTQNKIEDLYEECFATLDPYFMPSVRISIQKMQSINFPFDAVIRKTDVRGFFEGCLTDISDFVSSYSAMKSFREYDPEKAEQYLNKFNKRLYEIAAKENILPNQTTTLFIDYTLVICTNVKT